MATIRLPKEIVKETIFYSSGDFEFEGETYVLHEDLGIVGVDDDGRVFSYIYKRESDGKFFRIEINQIRYGYEDYGYEDFANDNELYEVEEVEITRKVWKRV